MTDSEPEIHEHLDPAPSERRKTLRMPLPRTRSVATIALIVLALIVLPSALLGFLSWRAIENERSFSRERLSESYRDFTRLAARQVDFRLHDLEPRWTAELDALLANDSVPSAAELAGRTGQEQLVSGFFLIHLPDRRMYPTIPLDYDGLSEGWEQETHVRENEVFTRLVDRGEELEYRAKDLDGAIAAYRMVPDEVSSSQLRAMAESYVGRVQLKKGDFDGAIATFRELVARYPNMRDLNRLYLRFLAQYQIAVALEAQGKNRAALDALLELNRDLLRRSDAINTAQYSYYCDLIQALAPRLLNAPDVTQRGRYERQFLDLADQNKKRISGKYFLQLLDAELNDIVIRRKNYTPRVQYLSASTEGEPFLLAYRALPDAKHIHTTGVLAAQINLRELLLEVAPTIRSLPSAEAAVSIIGAGRRGNDPEREKAIATQDLAAPFSFWQVSIHLHDVPGAMKRLDFRTTLWLWLVCLMGLVILVGTYLFIVHAYRQARMSRAQATFVSKVTHELRTPLSSIKMFAELLEMRLGSLPRREDAPFLGDAEQYLGIIGQECDRLGRLIDRVIDFSKVEHRIQHYHFEYHDVGDIVSRILASFRPLAEAQGFTLELTVDDALPRARLDPDALTQVLLNLLSNAVQFSDEVKQIHVRVRLDDDAVAIDVTDRGIGIDPKEMGRLFDTFYSGSGRTASRNLGGLGLGLSLSREIVREHGGKIRVRSTPGEGSTFTVLLPVGAADGAVRPGRARLVRDIQWGEEIGS